MTIGEARKELKAFQQEAFCIERKEWEIVRLSEKIDRIMINCREINEQDVQKLEAIYKDYIDAVVKMYRHKLTVEKTIASISQPIKNVLTLVYLESLKLEEVAEKLGYNYAYTSRLNSLGVAMYAEKRASQRPLGITRKDK